MPGKDAEFLPVADLSTGTGQDYPGSRMSSAPESKDLVVQGDSTISQDVERSRKWKWESSLNHSLLFSFDVVNCKPENSTKPTTTNPAL